LIEYETNTFLTLDPDTLNVVHPELAFGAKASANKRYRGTN
jgi:hypothetical protein